MHVQVREELEKSQIKSAHPSGKHLEKRNAQYESQCSQETAKGTAKQVK